jgi:hypothetical protein
VELRRRARLAYDELGAAAADVDHERALAPRPCRGRAEEGQPRLLAAGDRARVDPEAIAHLRLELAAVGAVADGAGRHRDDPLGAVLVDRHAEAGERLEHPLDRRVRQPSRRVDALTEAGDDRAAIDLAQGRPVGIGDEQSR